MTMKTEERIRLYHMQKVRCLQEIRPAVSNISGVRMIVHVCVSHLKGLFTLLTDERHVHDVGRDSQRRLTCASERVLTLDLVNPGMLIGGMYPYNGPV